MVSLLKLLRHDDEVASVVAEGLHTLCMACPAAELDAALQQALAPSAQVRQHHAWAITHEMQFEDLFFGNAHAQEPEAAEDPAAKRSPKRRRTAGPSEAAPLAAPQAPVVDLTGSQDDAAVVAPPSPPPTQPLSELGAPSVQAAHAALAAALASELAGMALQLSPSGGFHRSDSHLLALGKTAVWAILMHRGCRRECVEQRRAAAPAAGAAVRSGAQLGRAACGACTRAAAVAGLAAGSRHRLPARGGGRAAQPAAW